MCEGQGIPTLTTTLQSLSWYVQSHFEAEETLMQRYNYSVFADHKTEHDQFAKQISGYVADYESGRKALSVEVMDAMQKWLVRHIRRSDQTYVAFFRSVGIVRARGLEHVDEGLARGDEGAGTQGNSQSTS
jgi:hemerythrin-like metal-binding protein